MIKEAIEKILTMARPEVVEIDAREYLLKGRDPAVEVYPKTIQINNLSGIVDYCSEDPEEIGSFLVHVCDYNNVYVYTPMHGPFNIRPELIKASARLCGFNFGIPYGYEDFVVAMHTNFVQNEDRDYVLKFIGSVRVDANSKIEDDGISQTLTAKQGVSSLVKDIPIKNILTLKPYRTFSEIEQPESVFVFRMNVADGKPVFSIHEADGEAWKQAAIERIKDYLLRRTGPQEIAATVSIVA
ncbi:hypothetical protein [Desulfotignum phosphitoxidans]|jgi:hypothetical protein|uniref:Phage-like protein n=1 Tax=Desulfotignum phosphitoxidans DSM 13687 TaxID=1286635 RepID=S0FWV2_9BACT|nr:hypothetical protein [Desulfotignum phosphitoxidans]EMS79180.1 phage-like protein [Desulfotignum phosphitoxidans DSM 13687]